MAISKELVMQIFHQYGVKKEIIEAILADKLDRPYGGLIDNATHLRISTLGSSSGIFQIIRILLEDKVKEYYSTLAGETMANKINRNNAAMILSHISDNCHDRPALDAFSLFGTFLGYGISEASKYICASNNKNLQVVLAGPIMKSYQLFTEPLKKAIIDFGGNCILTLSDSVYHNYNSNMHGAYLTASSALKNRT